MSFDGSADINLAGVNTAGNQNTTGNAATATALQNARTIAGQSFDGTANITIAPTDLTSVTANATEINQLDGIDLIPTSPTWTSATEIPSNSQISDRIAELGGFEAIADEDSFPATAPPEGVVVCISNAKALAVSAAGVGAGGCRWTGARSLGSIWEEKVGSRRDAEGARQFVGGGDAAEVGCEEAISVSPAD